MIKYMNTSEDYLTTGSPACDNRPNNNICFLQHIQLSKYTPHSSMDKLSRLQKLLGDGDAVTDTSAFDALTLGSGVKAHHLYEGSSDSEDGVLRMDAVVVEPKVNKSKKSKGKKSTNEVAAQPVVRSSGTKEHDRKYQLQLGELAAEDEIFCPWRAVKDYPWKFVGTANRDQVVATFYEAEQYFDEHWDFFYIHRGTSDLNQQPVILVPTAQLVNFFDTINQTLGTNLTIPSGGANPGFQLQFYNDGCPRPRYLGHSTNFEMAQQLHKNIPPAYYKLNDEPDALGSPDARSLAAFKAKMESMIQLQKNRKAATAEKRKRERLEKQKQWGHGIKRVQRYLGLREVQQVDEEAIKARLQAAGVYSRGDLDVAVRAAIAKLGPPASFDPEKPALFNPEGEVVFVCVDIEAWEKNSKMITEIGVATLDTRDIKGVLPGKNGEYWMAKIRARHFRIKEHAHLHNTEYVEGCADKFDFGKSEFIALNDAPKVIASCFKPPFSGPDQVSDPDRPIILLGHDTAADVNFMSQLGYDVHNLRNLQEIADTASMWRYLKREPNPRNLGMILYELEIAGWNLHNAGNDAVFTLQAMIAMSIKHIEDKQKAAEKEKEKKLRISESIKEATEAALEKEEGWSSSGENSDGGAPISPTPLKAKLSSTTISRQTASRNAQSLSSPTPAPHSSAFTMSAFPSLPSPKRTQPLAGFEQIPSHRLADDDWGLPQEQPPKLAGRSKSLQAGMATVDLDDWGMPAPKPANANEGKSSWDTYNAW